MLAIERKNEILTLLELEGSVLVAPLAVKYAVAEETIRRDLEKLEQDGLARRTYGGAILVSGISADASYRVRAKTNIKQKSIIADKLFDLVGNGESILMDASSTSVLVARTLKSKKKLTILTNSVEILLDFADNKDISVISTGGVLRDSSLSLVGRDAERIIDNYTADKAIISCKGIDFDKGVTESNIAEAEIKKAMVANAKHVILALDSSKFDRLSFAKLVDLKNLHTVVTDKLPSERWREYFAEHNIILL